MKPHVHRLPHWIATDKPWLVIAARSVGFFATWHEAHTHATQIA